jgi:hypothetical protein
MAYFRLHRRFKILPGVRINLAKTGPSLSLGTNDDAITPSTTRLIHRYQAPP